MRKRALEPLLHLLLMDDVMAWYASKSSAKTDQKMQEVGTSCRTGPYSPASRNRQSRLKESSPRIVEARVEDAVAEVIRPNPDPICESEVARE